MVNDPKQTNFETRKYLTFLSMIREKKKTFTIVQNIFIRNPDKVVFIKRLTLNTIRSPIQLVTSLANKLDNHFCLK